MLLVVDETRYLVNETGRLLGVLQQILDWQLFALRSAPLAGIYQAVTRNVLHLFRFHRDGRFEEARGEGSTLVGLLPQLEKPGSQGRYELIGGKLTLQYQEGTNAFPPFGQASGEGQLTIFRYAEAEPVQYTRLAQQ